MYTKSQIRTLASNMTAEEAIALLTQDKRGSLLNDPKVLTHHWMTPTQRAKIRALGGSRWLRTQIDAAVLPIETALPSVKSSGKILLGDVTGNATLDRRLIESMDARIASFK